MTSLNTVWKEAATLWAQVLQRAWIWLLFTAFVSSGLDVLIEYIRKMDDRLALLVGVFSLLLSLFLTAFSTIIISQIIVDVKRKTHVSLREALDTNLKPVFVETTRAIVPILLKLLLFIIPGFVEMARLCFVSYIAQFDQEYKRGQVDALVRSRELVQGRFWKITGILLLTTALSILPTLWKGGLSIEAEPFFYAVALAFCVIAEAYSETVLYLTYEKVAFDLRNKNVDSVSLSGTSSS